MRVRYKLLLILLPLNFTFLLLMGTGSQLLATNGMYRLAARNLSFKADQIRAYAASQWKLVAQFADEDKESLITAVSLSLYSFAESMLVSPSEVVVLLNPESQLLFLASRLEERRSFLPADPELIVVPMTDGLHEFNWKGEEQLGVVRDYAELGWKILIFDSRDSFLAEIRLISRRILIILLLSLLLSTLTILFVSRWLLKPLQAVNNEILQILASSSLNRQIEVTSGDEFGDLALRFNVMTAELDRTYRRVEEIALKEAQVRLLVAEREEETLQLLGKAGEFKDHETGVHVLRVGQMSRLLADAIGEDSGSQRIIYFAAPLHDIGKIGIPDHILLKKGRLEPEEWKIMQTHTEIGYSILKDSGSHYIMAGAAISLYHHECWDGSGYPYGIAGEEIPLYARILAIADVFEALISERPYKKAWAAAAARQHILDNSGTQFQPELVQEFDRLFSTICKLFSVTP